jgi:hypothetical protein
MTDRAEQPAPRARKDGLVVEELPDELLVYDLDRHKAHCLNETAALIWKRCDGRTTVAAMARAIEGELNAPVGEEVVRFALDQLDRSCLLEGWAPRSPKGKLSRREAMRRLGLAAALAVPVVTSIVAPTAAEAVTCKGSGAICGSSAECCSGVCNAGLCT